MIFILEVTQPKNSYKGIHSVVCDCQILRFFFFAIYAEHNLITVGISTILSKKDFKYFLMFHFDFIIYFNSCGQSGCIVPGNRGNQTVLWRCPRMLTFLNLDLMLCIWYWLNILIENIILWSCRERWPSIASHFIWFLGTGCVK